MKQNELQTITAVIEVLEAAYRVAPDTAQYRNGIVQKNAAAYILEALVQLRTLIPDVSDTTR